MDGTIATQDRRFFSYMANLSLKNCSSWYYLIHSWVLCLKNLQYRSAQDVKRHSSLLWLKRWQNTIALFGVISSIPRHLTNDPIQNICPLLQEAALPSDPWKLFVFGVSEVFCSLERYDSSDVSQMSNIRRKVWFWELSHKNLFLFVSTELRSGH